MKKRLFSILTVILLMLACAPTALADSGPKPSVVVEFRGLEGETYYATLLSATDSTGPWSYRSEVYDGQEGDVWTTFHNYQDIDGFYFLGHYEDCTESQTFTWGYYPPQTFKLLLYFPEYDRMIVSENIYERYAFDSYFAADARSLDIQNTSVAGTAVMPISQTYDFSWELISLLCRIVLTIGVELLLALAFRFRSKRQLRVIIVTNLATQIGLNVLLNIVNYNRGAFAFVACYILLEFLVFIIEGCVYAGMLPRRAAEPERKSHPWLYALTANVASFAVGMLVARWMPGIF